MDFTRPSQSQPANSGTAFSPAPASGGGKKNNKNRSIKWKRWGSGVLGLIVVVLIAALVVAIGFGGPKAEGSYVDSNKLQAVFLNTGQVYFGNLKTVNSKYFVLDNIYYLQTSGGSSSTTSSSNSSNTSVSLVKLGCELHAPYDQMVINRDQVTFWENLQSDGQVAKAVATFQKDNPNGQKCSDQSNAGSTTNVQGSGNSTPNTTPSTTPNTNNGSTTNP